MSEMSGEDLRARLAGLVDDARAAGLGWDEVARVLGPAADDARHRAAETAAARVDGGIGGGGTGGGTGGGGTGGGGTGGGTGGRETDDGAPATPEEHAPERTSKIGPVTLFNEMGALERAGRRGFRVVGTGSALHIVVHTPVQWEYRRVFASRATGRALEADGWQRFSSGWFPWGYYQRATDRPAEAEPVVGGYLIEP